MQHFMAAAPLLAAAALATQASLPGRRARPPGRSPAGRQPGPQSKSAAPSPRAVAPSAAEQARSAPEPAAHGLSPEHKSHEGMAGAGRGGLSSPFNLSRRQAAAALKVGRHPDHIWLSSTHVRLRIRSPVLAPLVPRLADAAVLAQGHRRSGSFSFEGAPSAAAGADPGFSFRRATASEPCEAMSFPRLGSHHPSPLSHHASLSQVHLAARSQPAQCM